MDKLIDIKKKYAESVFPENTVPVFWSKTRSSTNLSYRHRVIPFAWPVITKLEFEFYSIFFYGKLRTVLCTAYLSLFAVQPSCNFILL